jgi:hypothetical protein
MFLIWLFPHLSLITSMMKSISLLPPPLLPLKPWTLIFFHQHYLSSHHALSQPMVQLGDTPPRLLPQLHSLMNPSIQKTLEEGQDP